MRLTMKERQKTTVIVATRYQKARKKDKGKILDEFIELTGYTRCYGAYVLRTQGKKVRGGGNRTFVLDVRTKATRKRQRVYDESVREALRKIWYIMDCICGKRLSPILGEVLWKLERYKEISLDATIRQKLLGVSASTIDRLLAPERRKQTIKGKGNTKPGTLLKHQIPIRTFAEWNDKRPGFVEIDLVGHDGGDSRGDYIQTLDVTDVSTGWTETHAVRNKAQVWVFEALQSISKQLPFDLLGIDSDNGSEFINNHLLRFCSETQITFTRSRSYRKNDNCFVEQKNYSVVRRAVGYLRYDTEKEQRLLDELYGYLRLYTNFFQPVMKLMEKTRAGSRVKKTYDTAQTPYRRVLGSPHVSEDNKKRLKRLYASLNPAELKRHITKVQNKLIHLASLKETVRRQKHGTEQSSVGGYSDMGRAEKTPYSASCESTPSAILSLPPARRRKKVKIG